MGMDWRQWRSITGGRKDPTKICLVGALGMRARSEERAQQKFCHGAGDEAGGLDLEERKGGERRSICVLGKSGLCVTRECLLELRVEIKQRIGGGRLEGEIQSVGSTRGVEGGCHR